MQQHSEQSVVPGAKLIKTLIDDGEPLQIVCRRDWREALKDLGLLVRILPQNGAVVQGGNDVPVDSDRAVLGAGSVRKLGHVRSSR